MDFIFSGEIEGRTLKDLRYFSSAAGLFDRDLNI